MWPYEATFDGGARSIEGAPKVTGAGATLWRRDCEGGPPQLAASCVVALPGTDNAQIAEATGCRAALALLTGPDPDYRAARVVGDNLAAVRYGAGTGQYRRIHLGEQMDPALRPLAEGGALTWQAVRRRLNVAADRLAALGVFWAHALAKNGTTRALTWTVWHDR